MGKFNLSSERMRHIIRVKKKQKKKNPAEKGLVVLCHFHNRNVALTTDSLNTG